MKKVVISIGGSKLFENKEVDSKFLKEVKDLVNEFRGEYKLGVLVGGGYIARDYIKAAKELGFNSDQQDEIAIACTRVNAALLKLFVLGEKEIRRTVGGMKKEIQEEGVVIAGGTKPGHTTDMVSTLLASSINSKRILNLTDVKGVYNKDPHKHKDAKLIKKMTWEDFFSIIGRIEHFPGLNLPFEPQAAELCKKKEMEVAVTNSLEEASKYLNNKSFEGTLIHSSK